MFYVDKWPDSCHIPWLLTKCLSFTCLYLSCFNNILIQSSPQYRRSRFSGLTKKRRGIRKSAVFGGTMTTVVLNNCHAAENMYLQCLQFDQFLKCARLQMTLHWQNKNLASLAYPFNIFLGLEDGRRYWGGVRICQFDYVHSILRFLDDI